MQNEETPTEVNPFMDIAAGMSKPPAAPTIPTDNPFMDLAPSVRTVSQPPAMGSLSAVAGINPDQAAEATKLGTPLGIGQDLALRNMDELRRRSTIASVQRSGLLQNNPRLAQSLLDPVFAAQAHDDLDSLEKTSSLFDKAVNFIGPELFDRRPGQALRIAKVLEDGYAIGELGAELGALKSRRKGYIAFGGTPENETVLNDRIAFLEKQLANKEPSGFFGSAAMVTAQALAMARPVGTVALMGAGVGGAVGGAPGAAAGFVAGLQAGIVGTTAQVEGGFLFDDMVAQGVEPETAYYASVAGGTVIGIIELVGDRLFAGSFKPITRFLRQELTQQLAKPTIRSAAAEFGKQTLKQMAVGGAEEGSQRLVADAFSELGKAIDGVPTDFTWSQMAKNIASDFAAGVQGSALIGAAGPGLSLMVDVRRAEAVSAQEEFFDGLDAAKKDGKLPKRNLDAYEGFLARQAKGTTADTVYVEAEAAAQVLAQSGLSAEQLEQSIPGIREQLRNALENGGDVTIPTSVYGARLAGTPLGDALRPHVRLSPEAMSVAQAQEFSRKRDALRQEAQAALAERQEADAAFVESAQKVETTVAEQLRQTGMQDIEVRANAELFRDLAVTQAARMGITPEQFYERYPYRVRGPQAVQEGQPLEQAVRPELIAQLTDSEVRELADYAYEVGAIQSDLDALETELDKREVEEDDPSGGEETISPFGGEVIPQITTGYGVEELMRQAATLARQEGYTTQQLGEYIRTSGDFAMLTQMSPRPEVTDEELGREAFAALEAHEARLATMRERLRRNGDVLRQSAALQQASRIDADYLAAVERGDMATAQRMVDEAARAAGYTLRGFHGTNADFTQFNLSRTGNFGPGVYLSFDETDAREYARRVGGSKVLSVVIRATNPFRIKDALAASDFFDSFPAESDAESVAKAQAAGYDAVLAENDVATPFGTNKAQISVFDPSQIKLADPVVYDEAGNVVPLSRRFDITSPKVFEQAAQIPKVDGVALRRAMNQYIRNEIYALELIEEVNLFGLVTEEEVDDLLDQDAKNRVAGVSSRGGGSTSIPGEMGRRGQHPLLALVRQREKERPTAIARRDAFYLDAVQRDDIDQAQYMVDQAAYAQGYRFEAFHGTDAKDFSAFKYGDTYNWGPALYFSPSREYAAEYLDRTGEGEPRVMRVKLRIDNMFSPEYNPEHTKLYRRLAQEARDEGLTHQEFDISGPQGTEVKYGNTGLSNLVTYTDQWWLVEKLWREGFDGFRTTEADGETVGIAVRDPSQIKLADPVTYDEAGNVVPLSRRFDITSPKVFEQAAMFEQAPVSPGFYSALAKSVDAIDAKSLAPSGWKERIKGLVNKGEVKQDEVDWSGLTDWLDMQEGKVTKEAVAEFLKNNGVRVERVQLGGTELENLLNEHARAEMEYDDALEAERAAQLGTDEAAWNAADARLSEARRRVSVLSARLAETERAATKFSQYTLPGGTNYREVLITLPQIDRVIAETAETLLKQGFRVEQAYDELYDATDAIIYDNKGNRVSTTTRLRGKYSDEDLLRDFAQSRQVRQQRQARRDSYVSPHWDEPNVLVHFRLNDRVDADGKRVLFVEEIQSDWGQAGRKRGFKGKVPLAPFVETTDGWLNLALKHILLEATQGNYDRVAFVNGRQSADRYDLSKQVLEIYWKGYASRGATKLVTITPLQGNLIEIPIDDRGVAISTDSQFDGKPLDEIVPKEIADQIMASLEGDIRGDGLKVGGSGMLEFYDKIVPAAVNKLLKKYGGGKLEIREFKGTTPLTNYDINPRGSRWALVDAYTREQIPDTPLFASGGAAEEWIATQGPSSKGPSSKQASFPITPEMVKKLESGLPLFQAARAPRGEFDPAKLMTTLREGRDFSTFAHETAHFYLTILADIARSATGPQQTKADMDALLTWFGIEGATPAERLAKWSSLTIDQQRQYHEQFAYSFEIYLHEGKAPSVEMQSLFNQFAAWLKRVYKSIRDELNATYKAQFGRDLPMMSSEIRLVMDRMLATDEQIARAQAVRGMKALFQTQEQSAMSDAEWAAYQALEQDATDAATAELTKATLRELQWYGNAQSKYLREIQAKHDRARKEIREEVSAQVQLEPVYRAMEFLKKGTIRTDTGEVTAATGAFKLDLAKVRAIMPAGFDPASLKYGKYGMVQEGGIDPDMAAGMFGYGSGVELINAILGAKPIKEEIDARTDQRMLDENSDLATPEARQAAVDMAIHNEARARFIAVEQRWLEKQRRPANDMLQAARQVAQDIIGDVVIRTLNPRRYEAAEAEAARTATTAYREPQDPSTAGQAAATRAYNEAIAAGRTPDEATVAATEAGVAAVAKAQERRAEFDATYGGREPAEVARRAKRQQLVQNQLAREAMLAKEEIAVAGRDFRKFFRSDEKLAKTRDMAPIMAARAILSYYGYGKRGESPAQYLEQLRTYAPDLYDGIAPIVLKSLSGTADYRDLTVTEFRVLRDTVQALWAQARRDRQITVEGERVALDVVLKEMTDRLQEIGVGERVGQRQAPGVIDRANRHLLGLRAMMTRVEAWADALDGMAGPGAFTKYLFRPVKQAVDAYRIERNKYVERFVKLLDGIDLPVGKIAAPELDYTFGNGNGGIGRAELLGALMHTGNEGNYRKLLLGRGWGELDADGNLDDSRWRSFIARMIAEGKLTKADYDFVQSIWDLLEEIKPLAQRAHFDMYGYYFKEVEATEVVTPFGTYRGGYVPAATDKFMVQDARVNASMDELEGDWRNSLPSTGAGFTKGRVDYNEALSLDLRLIATHTDAVLRFSMIQPSVKDALKILRDRDLKALLERFDPAIMENMLLPWLNRAARQQATEPGRWKVADKFWGGVRSRAGVATMFANLRNALQQVTGWFPSLLKVKRRYLQSALMTYLGSPKQTAEAVARLSPFMADRMRNQMFELQGTMNELLLNPSKYEKLQQWSSKHGYFLQQAFQNMVDVTTWQGAYNQALAEGETQAEAVSRGDAAVRLTQGSLSPEDLSMFEVGTPFYRTFVQFTGYFNMLANLNLGEFQKTVRDMGWRSGKGRLIYIYVMGLLLPAIVSDAIVRSLGGGWDDEDEDGYMDVFMDWFFGSQVRMGAALLPFGSTAYTAITTAFNDKPYDDRITTSPSIAALESATIGASKAIIAVTDEDKDVTGRNVRDVLTLITLLTGVPVSALGRPAGYLIDVERGEIEPESGYDMIRGMITGTATPESKR